MSKLPFNISDFMNNLKPVKTVGFMELCANYYNDAKNAYLSGDSVYEVSGRNTKSGNPWIVFFN